MSDCDGNSHTSCVLFCRERQEYVAEVYRDEVIYMPEFRFAKVYSTVKTAKTARSRLAKYGVDVDSLVALTAYVPDPTPEPGYLELLTDHQISCHCRCHDNAPTEASSPDSGTIVSRQV